MRTSCLITGLVVFAFAAAACAQETATESMAKPEALNDKASYGFGLNLGRNLKQQDVDLDIDYLIQGLRDGLAEAESAMLTDEEIESAMQEFQKQVMAEQQAKRETQATENKTEAEAFLATNKDAEGVHSTDSGLQYKVLTEGDGPKPSADDRVSVHYKGTLLDGTVFDSSYDRGQPAVFPVTGVIPGWVEAIQMMPVGSKWQLWIPPDLAYGDRGAGPKIGPNALLVFEVELLGIEEEQPAAQGQGQGQGQGQPQPQGGGQGGGETQ